jgi:hypothetical protein
MGKEFKEKLNILYGSKLMQYMKIIQLPERTVRR